MIKGFRHRTYKLIGFINMLNLIPEFVHPVFECNENGKYYLQFGDEEELVLEKMVSLSSNLYNKVVKLSDIETNEFEVIEDFSLESDPIFAFQFSKYFVHFGNCKDIKEAIKGLKTGNPFVDEDISDFIKYAGCLA